MALYDFRCESCAFTDEFIVNIAVAECKEAPKQCPKCGGVMKKLFSTGKTIGIDFIGPGFWINDNGIHAWKKRLSPADQVKVLTKNENNQYKDPY